MSDKEILRVSGLCKSYGDARILDRVELGVTQGEKVCVLGPSGSGKTTLLRCLNGLAEPDAGTLSFEGAALFQWPTPRSARARHRKAMQVYRQRMAMVFQQFELFPHLTVVDNVTLGPRHSLGVPRAEATEKAMGLLAQVGMAEHAKKHPRNLSGGQQQRVAIARALAMNPAAILFDEPTSALDPEMAYEVVEIMRRLADEGMTMIIVTHDMAIARHIADRVVVMDRGEIIEQGPSPEIFTNPQVARTGEILRIREQV